MCVRVPILHSYTLHQAHTHILTHNTNYSTVQITERHPSCILRKFLRGQEAIACDDDADYEERETVCETSAHCDCVCVCGCMRLSYSHLLVGPIQPVMVMVVCPYPHTPICIPHRHAHHPTSSSHLSERNACDIAASRRCRRAFACVPHKAGTMMIYLFRSLRGSAAVHNRTNLGAIATHYTTRRSEICGHTLFERHYNI